MLVIGKLDGVKTTSGILLLVTALSVSFAQSDYLIEGQTGSTLVRIYPSTLVGQDLVLLREFLPSQEVSNEGYPYRIVSYSFNGIDATGTLHISKSTADEDDGYEVGTVENYVFDAGNMPLIIPSDTSGDEPRIEINVEAMGNGEVSITLSNVEDFEAYSE